MAQKKKNGTLRAVQKQGPVSVWRREQSPEEIFFQVDLKKLGIDSESVPNQSVIEILDVIREKLSEFPSNSKLEFSDRQVLLVSNNTEILHDLVEQIQKKGAVCTTFGLEIQFWSGLSNLTKGDSPKHLDLLIVSMRLSLEDTFGSRSGIELIEKVRKLGYTAPVILLINNEDQNNETVKQHQEDLGFRSVLLDMDYVENVLAEAQNLIQKDIQKTAARG